MRCTSALLLVVPAIAFAGSKKYDVSTDAKLDEAIKSETGYDADPHCTLRMTDEFAKVVLVGSFANDRGCVPEGYFADGVYVMKRSSSAPALATAGWGNAAKRSVLAVKWASAMIEGSFSGDPTAVTRKDGGVVVTGWVNEPVGMVPEQRSDQLELRFTAAGDVTTNVLATKVTKFH